MLKTVKEFLKRILVVTMIFITLVIFGMEPIAKAAQLPADGEFYYSGTTKGTYVVTENIFKWLLSHLADIVDWLLGFMTMAFRLSIIGWATILERLLTKVLESSAGNSYLSDALNATNITAANDSSQNVTVEAIVYNRVPLFNVNFFDFEVDKTRTGTGRDLTKLVCDRCKKYYGDCTCTEEMCVCTSCETYRIMQKVDSDPNYKSIIIIIKETVAEWFYMIRFIAVIGMLMVLILIGIKIAISTLSSEKAVYKRMLVDWLVGFLFLFAVQYIMFFIIYLNQLAVDLIADYSENQASAIIQTSSLEFGKKERDNEEVEASLYEAVRTRAYDPKLINGTTGTIMYITLVIFAWRFAWMYLKRYFTLIVLTLMAPAVAFAYALQKVFAGKAKAWSTWLNEYIVNTFIQTVHAILYASFVSTALIVSLDSIAGMVVGLIIMNFMLKADKVFRKIFKMSTGGSLLDRVSKGAEEARLDKMAKSVQNAVAGAKPALQLAAKSPGAALVRGAKNAVVGNAVMAGARITDAIDRKREKNLEAQAEKNLERDYGEGFQEFKSKNDGKEFNAAKLKEMDRLRIGNSLKDKVRAMDPDEKAAHAEALVGEEKAALKAAMAAQEMNLPIEKQRALFDKYHAASKRRKEFGKYAKLGRYSTAQIVKARLFDVNKYYYRDEKGKLKRRSEYVFNEKTGLIERVGAAKKAAGMLNAKDALGWDDETIKALKGATSVALGGIGAEIAAFAGLATLVSSPGVAMGMLAYSANSFTKLTRANRNISRPTHRAAYRNKHYNNLQLSSQAMERVTETVIYETIAGFKLSPYKGAMTLQTMVAARLFDAAGTPEEFKAMVGNESAYKGQVIATLDKIKAEDAFISSVQADKISELDEVELKKLDAIVKERVAGFDDLSKSEKNDQRSAVFSQLSVQHNQLKGIDLTVFEQEEFADASMRQVNEYMLEAMTADEFRALLDDPALFEERVNSELQNIATRNLEIDQQHQVQRELSKARHSSESLTKLNDVVDEMYEKDILPNMKTGDVLDRLAGGAAEELDKIAALDNKAELKFIARMKTDADLIVAARRERELADEIDKVDEISAKEDKDRADATVGKTGQTRIVNTAVLTTTLDKLIREAMRELGYSQPLNSQERAMLINKVKSLARGQLKADMIEQLKADFDGEITDDVLREIENKVNNKINSEVDSKVDGRVDAEIRKHKDIMTAREDARNASSGDDETKIVEAIQREGITSEERESISQHVKNVIAANNVISVEELNNDEKVREIAQAYLASSGGTISQAEAEAQVNVFMSELKVEKTFKARTQEAMQRRLDPSVTESYAEAKDNKKRSQIVEETRRVAMAEEDTVSPEVLAEQSRIVADLIATIEPAREKNREYVGYGTARKNDTKAMSMPDYNDYMQYVEFNEKRGLPPGYTKARKNSPNNLEAFGPLLNLNEIVASMTDNDGII